MTELLEVWFYVFLAMLLLKPVLFTGFFLYKAARKASDCIGPRIHYFDERLSYAEGKNDKITVRPDDVIILRYQESDAETADVHYVAYSVPADLKRSRVPLFFLINQAMSIGISVVPPYDFEHMSSVPLRQIPPRETHVQVPASGLRRLKFRKG